MIIFTVHENEKTGKFEVHATHVDREGEDGKIREYEEHDMAITAANLLQESQ